MRYKKGCAGWTVARVESRGRKHMARRMGCYGTWQEAHEHAGRLADKHQRLMARGVLDFIVERVPPGDRTPAVTSWSD